MNILLDARVLGRGGTTGITGYARDLFDELIVRHGNHRYQLMYPGWRKEPLPTHWIERSNVSVCDMRIPNKVFDIATGLNLIHQLPAVEKSDVVFNPHFNAMPGLGLPRVLTFHDLSFLRRPDFFSPRQKFWHELQQYRKQAKSANRIIAISEHTKSDIIELLGVPDKKISVIYSGISGSFRKIEATGEQAHEVTRRYDLHKPFFLYLGTLERRKNVASLVRAFTLVKNDPRFKEYLLVLAGRPGYGTQEIRKAISESPARADIRIIGNCSDADRPVLYSLARAFVYPSFFEGFGFPPLEAQTCGTPVICANRTSLPEILGDSAVLIDPWKINEIADALVAVETDSTLRNSLIKAGYTNSKRFTWESTASATLRVIESAYRAE